MGVITNMPEPSTIAEENRLKAVRRISEIRGRLAKQKIAVPEDYYLRSESVTLMPEGEGGTLRWTAPKMVDHRKRQGWEVVPASDYSRYGRSKEEAHEAEDCVRWNELILMRRNVDLQILSIEQRGLTALDQVTAEGEKYVRALEEQLGDTPEGARRVQRIVRHMEKAR